MFNASTFSACFIVTIITVFIVLEVGKTYDERVEVISSTLTETSQAMQLIDFSLMTVTIFVLVVLLHKTSKYMVGEKLTFRRENRNGNIQLLLNYTNSR